jgi:hypothetical protein
MECWWSNKIGWTRRGEDKGKTKARQGKDKEKTRKRQGKDKAESW